MKKTTFTCDICNGEKDMSEFHKNGNEDHICCGNEECYDCYHPVPVTLVWCNKCISSNKKIRTGG
jgi:hypothetical protein